MSYNPPTSDSLEFTMESDSTETNDTVDFSFAEFAGGFNLDIKGTNSPIYQQSALVMDVDVLNDGDGTAQQGIDINDPDGNAVETRSYELDPSDQLTTRLVWEAESPGEYTISASSDDVTRQTDVEVLPFPGTPGGVSLGSPNIL